jgi:ribosomal protein S18 acetylase RimI-like enzyme
MHEVTGGLDADPAVRAFRDSDREAVVELWRRCELLRPWNDPDRDIDRKLALEDDLLLVAEGADGVVGSVMVGYEGHRGWLNYLAVDPDRRGRGIGRALVAAGEARLRALGCPKVNLQVRRTNIDAAGFYRSLGFVDDDVVSLGKRLIDDQPADPAP